MTALALALSLCALLAWDAWRRWLAVVHERAVDAEALSVLRRDLVDGLATTESRATARVAQVEERVRLVEAVVRDGKLARVMR